jgi:hypothetical protein
MRVIDRGVALHGDAQQEPDLLVEQVASMLRRFRRRRHNIQLFATHRWSIFSTTACNQALANEKA